MSFRHYTPISPKCQILFLKSRKGNESGVGLHYLLWGYYYFFKQSKPFITNSVNSFGVHPFISLVNLSISSIICLSNLTANCFWSIYCFHSSISFAKVLCNPLEMNSLTTAFTTSFLKTSKARYATNPAIAFLSTL